MGFSSRMSVGLSFVSVGGINGNKRRPLSLKGSKVRANEAERSSFISIYTTQVKMNWKRFLILWKI
jgi:hypothetical protein